MIPTSQSAADLLLSGGYEGVYVADVIVDGSSVLEENPISNVSMTWNGDARVRGTGRCVFTYSDDRGGSIVPEDVTSWMTPYATVLNISYRLTAGDFVEKILLGSFKVIKVTDPIDFRRPFLGDYISLGSSVGLQFADLSRVTDRERFPIPYGPSDLSSVWAEMGRLTLLPLLRNVADAAIPRAVTYKDNRLDAIYDLARVLGGTPYVNENGQLTIDPDEWPDESEELLTGSEGVVISRAPADLTDEEVYNQVVVRSWDDGQGSILATKELESGRLRYGGVMGRIPYFASSEYVTTAEQAYAYASDLLPKVSSLPALQLELEVVPDPRRQVGDVFRFTWDGVVWRSRVREVRLGDSTPMVLRVVAERVGLVVPPDDLWYPATDVYPAFDLYPAGG